MGDVLQESDTEYIMAATSPAGNNPLYMGDYNCSNYSLCHGDSYWVLHITDVFDYDNVEEKQMSNVRVFPNPAKGLFTVSANEIKRVQLYNILGQRVVEVPSYNGENVMVDGCSLCAGVYLVRVVTENGVVIKKLLVE